MLFEIERINQTSYKNYEDLTFPYFKYFLSLCSSEKNFLAFGAYIKDKPVGLVLAKNEEIKVSIYNSQILSIFVIPEYRNFGIASRLFTTIEDELIKEGANKILMRFNENAFHIRNILKNHKWNHPKSTGIIFYANLENCNFDPIIVAASQLESRLSNINIHVFQWKDISAQEVAEIKEKSNTNKLFRKYYPFFDEDFVEDNSVGLRINDQVIGWMITHRISRDTIRYSQLFIDPSYQPISRSIILLSKSIELQLKSASLANKACFRVEESNFEMMRFVNKRIKPYITSFEKTYLAVKKI